jgi:hypothetical protein
MRPRNVFSALRALGETIGFALCKLSEIQFAAPWNPRRRRCG